MMQMPFPFWENESDTLATLTATYSVDGLAPIEARLALEQHYATLIQHSARFNRRLVSYQANKAAPLHRWFRFKEAFSAQLVELLLNSCDVKEGDRVLDPFAGSGTTLFTAQLKGIHSVGIELMPVGRAIWQAKRDAYRVSVDALEDARNWLAALKVENTGATFPHVAITQGAFPASQENALMYYQQQIMTHVTDETVRSLLNFALLAILETVSYTRKDGQYLRWDWRSEKWQKRSQQRLLAGKPLPQKFDKGNIKDVRTALLDILDMMIKDVVSIQHAKPLSAENELMVGSALALLPTLAPDQFQAVITSPPYLNRYDYSRTYALELAFLGLKHDDFLTLRQSLLSATVENRSKREWLIAFYEQLERGQEAQRMMTLIETHSALQEVFEAIQLRAQQGQLNNKGVVPMITGYFLEMGFILYELCRVLKPNGWLAMVNDNVRYGGEVIPVDLLLLDLGKQLGLMPMAVEVIPQGKGNSSQQMGKYGREALRKSVIFWQKK